MLQRNDTLVYEMYHHSGIAQMFTDFEQQHRQFYEVFRSHQIAICKDSQVWRSIEVLDEAIDALIPYRGGGFVNAGEVPDMIQEKDTCRFMWIAVYLSEYTRNQDNPFSIESKLKLDLQPYYYSIAYGNKELARKKYDEYLTHEERKKIVLEALRDVFQLVKAQSRVKPG